MPKIIPELRERILQAARKRLLEDESHDFSTRQLAADCQVATGTIFNYFPTKEALLACIMLSDWQGCLSDMRREAELAEDPVRGFLRLEAALRRFSAPFLPVWQSYDRSAPIREHHGQLIAQLGGPITALLERFGKSCSQTELSLLAELLLAASLREAGTLERLLPVIGKIIG